MFVRLDWRKLTNDKHSSLLQKSVIYRQKKIYTIDDTVEPKGMKHLSDAPLLGRLLALPTNIRLGWQYLLETNTLAYYENP